MPVMDPRKVPGVETPDMPDARRHRWTPTHRFCETRDTYQMAALKIAFEAPDNSSMFRPSRERPIDLVHLANQTMGDKALEIEVLQMFSRQSRQLMKDMSEGSLDGRKAAAHRLKGAALAVGAHPVARAAEAIENRSGHREPSLGSLGRRARSRALRSEALPLSGSQDRVWPRDGNRDRYPSWADPSRWPAQGRPCLAHG